MHYLKKDTNMGLFGYINMLEITVFFGNINKKETFSQCSSSVKEYLQRISIYKDICKDIKSRIQKNG